MDSILGMIKPVATSLFGLVRVVFHHFHRLVYKLVLFEIVVYEFELINLVLNT